jgi:hypothetical protein
VLAGAVEDGARVREDEIDRAGEHQGVTRCSSSAGLGFRGSEGG